ncbi:DNA mismatch repair protein MutL [Labeo rohita]|uniref:DNA mismatch repair protein MutL n=1 Tax=Labeo rohita TaxID=84645 RepID=A0ABQ8L5U9_LABRO|nr:DNA mismatch repair protein MutL [Labeo rohita]
MKAEAPATSGEVSMAALADLLDEHRAALAAEFKAAIKTLEVKLDCVQATVTDHGQTLTALESHAESLDERVERLETSLASLTENNARLKAKTADLKRGILSSPPELDRAHRSLTANPKPGERPRAVVVRFHRYQLKDRVIREAPRLRIRTKEGSNKWFMSAEEGKRYLDCQCGGSQ